MLTRVWSVCVCVSIAWAGGCEAGTHAPRPQVKEQRAPDWRVRLSQCNGSFLFRRSMFPKWSDRAWPERRRAEASTVRRSWMAWVDP